MSNLEKYNMSNLEKYNMSNFQKVVDFNKAFGIFVSDTPLENIFQSDPKLVKLRHSLITEEIRELNEDGFHKKNFVEVVDALSDILYVVYGAGASFGINLDDHFNIYCHLKMSYYVDENISNFNRIKLIQSIESSERILTDFFDNPENVEIVFNKYVAMLNKEDQTLNRYIGLEDFQKVENSLVKMLDYTYSLGNMLGINLDQSFNIVHQSNMSKLCNNEEIAKKTVEWYKENELRYDSPNYRLCESEKGKFIVFNESTGKILKSIEYTPADFKIMF
jgi:predicted HAD superfamily Cof-like phosphohydrolase